MRIAVVLERQIRPQDPPGQLDIGRSGGDRVGDQIPVPGSEPQESANVRTQLSSASTAGS
ncbi:hypothetical protein [Streptomyces sp. NBC_00826]|uniref:hypothetical protein n=1 Tax=Streptomyces sp. NBC_00826 TaxID=2975845 RepID=UPI0038675634|nr:hypothetical protein OG832_40015 [Streptomyces sp. NBC_00826]